MLPFVECFVVSNRERIDSWLDIVLCASLVSTECPSCPAEYTQLQRRKRRLPLVLLEWGYRRQMDALHSEIFIDYKFFFWDRLYALNTFIIFSLFENRKPLAIDHLTYIRSCAVNYANRRRRRLSFHHKTRCPACCIASWVTHPPLHRPRRSNPTE